MPSTFRVIWALVKAWYYIWFKMDDEEQERLNKLLFEVEEDAKRRTTVPRSEAGRSDDSEEGRFRVPKRC